MPSSLGATTVAPRAAFESRDFTLYQAARLLLTIGTQVQSVAIGWYIYGRTGRAIDLGYAGLAQFLPMIALTLVTGHAADRFDRRRIVLLCYAGSALCAFLLFAETLFPLAQIWPLYAVLVLLGITRAFSGPAAQSLLPHLVPAEHFPNAVAWSSTTWQVATIVGPSVGGFLYGAFGEAGWVFFTSGVLSVIAAAMIARMEVRTGRMETRAASLRQLLAGVHYVWRAKTVLACISLDLFAVLLGGAVALLPIYAKDVLHVGPWGLGILRSAPAVGAALIAIALAYRPLKKHIGIWMLIAVAIFGVATIVFGFSHSFLLSLVALFVVGASDMISVVIRQTVVQLATPPQVRGRVSAVNQVFIGASNELGEFESGVTAAWFGAVPAVIIGGVGTIVVVALWALMFPELRQVSRVEDVKTVEVE